MPEDMLLKNTKLILNIVPGMAECDECNEVFNVVEHKGYRLQLRKPSPAVDFHPRSIFPSKINIGTRHVSRCQSYIMRFMRYFCFVAQREVPSEYRVRMAAMWTSPRARPAEVRARPRADDHEQRGEDKLRENKRSRFPRRASGAASISARRGAPPPSSCRG